MDQLQIFSNEEFGQVRTVERGGNILFCGSDVAKALGYSKPNNAVSSHCKHSTLIQGIATSQGNKVDMLFINEGDLYRLIIKSKLPSAEKFEIWVMDEVLPTIRKTGIYEQSRKLVFYEPIQIQNRKRVTIRVSSSAYRELDEIANRSGLSIREVADKMIHFAYQNTEMKPID